MLHVHIRYNLCLSLFDYHFSQTLQLTNKFGAPFDVDVNHAQNVAVYPMTGYGALPGDFMVLDYGRVGMV